MVQVGDECVLRKMGFPYASAGEESACNAGDLGSISGLGRSPGEGKGYPLQYSGLENFMDCTVHRVTKSWKGLSDFHLLTFKGAAKSVSVHHHWSAPLQFSS